MALTTVEYTYSGQSSFVLPFTLGILNRTYVTIQINNQVDGSGEPLYYTDFTWLSDGEIDIHNLTNGDLIKIARVIPSDVLLSDYTSGSNITRDNLDIANKQLMMLIHEVKDESSTQGSKLDTIEPNAKDDQTPAEIKTAYESIADTNAFTDADESKLDGIESGADVTDTANVTASGALMDSEVSDLAGIKSVNISTLQVKPSEGAFVDGDKTKLNTIETNADVTDTANVVAALTAGTNITIASDGTIASTATGGGGGGVSDIVDDLTPQLGGDLDLNGQDISGSGNIAITGTVNTRDMSVDGAKLDGIEAGATADQTKADIDALNIDADTLDGQHGAHYLDYNNLVNTPSIPGSGPSGYATESYVDTAVADIIDSAPGTLDTLNELAQALGDDPNFATTTATNLGLKLPKAGGTMTGDLNFTDGSKAIFGSDSDLKIFHDGTNSYINDLGAGDLVLQTNGAKIGLASASPFEWLLEAVPNNAVTLYYDGASKLATTSTGIDVSGNVFVNRSQTSGVADLLTLRDASAGAIYNFETYADPSFGTSNRLNYTGQYFAIRRSGTEQMRFTSTGIDVTGAVSINASSAPTWDTDTHFWAESGFGVRYDGYQHRWDVGLTRTEAMRIDSSGDVSIPSGNLDVTGTVVADKMFVEGTADSRQWEAGSAGQKLAIYAYDNSTFYHRLDTGNATNYQWGTYDNIPIYTITNNSVKTTLLANGNFGIGHTSPVAKMAILGSSNSTITEANSNLCVEGSGGNGMLFGTLSTTGFKSYIQSGFVSNLGTATYDLLLNPEGGNVGVGLSAPTAKMHLFTDGIDQSVFSAQTDLGANNRILTLKSPVSDSGSAPYRWQTSNSIQWEIDGTATKSMLLNSAGNLGVGTFSPTSKLSVAGDIDLTGDIDLPDASQIKIGTGDDLLMYQDGTASVIKHNTTGQLFFMGDDIRFVNQANNNAIMYLTGDVIQFHGNSKRVDNTHSYFGTGNDLDIYHDGSNSWIREVGTGALFIDSGTSVNLYANGNTHMLQAQAGAGVTLYYAGVGKFATTSSGAEVLGNLDVDNALNVGGASPAGSGFIESTVVGPSRALQTVGNVNTTQTHIGFENLSGEVGRIDVDVFSVSYVTSSDYRLKTDIVPIAGSIDRLKDLKPCNFQWIGTDNRVDGFIAHEAQEVVPEAVSGTKDATKIDKDGNSVPDYQGIDQAKLVPLLTAALQEAVAKIEAAEARIESLESQMLTLQLPQ